MGPAQRCLRHPNPFASKSIRLQEQFWIFTGEDRRIRVRRNSRSNSGFSQAKITEKVKKRDSPGKLETGSRGLKMGPAQRFLRHSNPFASKSIRLQEHFRILTGEDRRIGVRRNVDRFVDSYRRRSPKGAKQDSPGNVETGSRVLQIGAAKRFLRHSDPFASISFRLQRRF